MNARPADLIRRDPNLLIGPLLPAKRRADQLLTILIQQIIRILVRTRRDLDQLREPVPDLRNGQAAQEGEIQERAAGRVIGAETVLVVAVVDGDFDGYGGVDQADDGGGDADVVCVAAVGCAGEAGRV
jgi:hypothetical protein